MQSPAQVGLDEGGHEHVGGTGGATRARRHLRGPRGALLSAVGVGVVVVGIAELRRGAGVVGHRALELDLAGQRLGAAVQLILLVVAGGLVAQVPAPRQALLDQAVLGIGHFLGRVPVHAVLGEVVAVHRVGVRLVGQALELVRVLRVRNLLALLPLGAVHSLLGTFGIEVQIGNVQGEYDRGRATIGHIVAVGAAKIAVFVRGVRLQGHIDGVARLDHDGVGLAGHGGAVADVQVRIQVRRGQTLHGLAGEGADARRFQHGARQIGGAGEGREQLARSQIRALPIVLGSIAVVGILRDHRGFGLGGRRG